MNKLQIINNALIETGNDPLGTLYDGSDEWRAGDFAFDRAIKVLISMHQWPFATQVLLAARSGTPADPTYRDAYSIPANAWHVRGVLTAAGYPVSHYTIRAGAIHTSLNGADDILIDFVKAPEADANWHPMAEEVLTLMVEASLLRSLNEDEATARYRDSKVQDMLIRAQTRVDQQKPPIRGFAPSMTRVRRSRRA